jgi:hypothetical protein
MGVGTLGFLKGASSQMLSSLEARDKAELEVKKQDKLDQLREDRIQQREMKEAVTFKTEKTPTGYDRVGYNKHEKEVIRRAATAPEVDAQKQSEEDRGWILKERDMKEKDFKGDEAERAQRMRINANQDARAARSSSTAGAGGSSLDGSGGGLTLQDRVQETLYRNKDLLESVTKSSDPTKPAPLSRSEVEVGVESMIRGMAARGVPPSQIDSLLRRKLIPSLLDKKAK